MAASPRTQTAYSSLALQGSCVSRLELKVPPDVIWILVAGLMWLVSTRTPKVDLPSLVRVGTTVVLTVIGIWFVVGARMSLESADTTWRPLTPGQTTRLVSTGVYGLSRNPVYLGMLFVMLGLAIALSSPAALALSAVFVLYLNRFQIAPEERALSAVLGQEYLDYQARVRRWL
jgi:protein-S-isoprenylcysteine O-methyltransferase Ste14